jgi:NADPH-dependent glutamate synthase beta subunit-like oxidoreductase
MRFNADRELALKLTRRRKKRSKAFKLSLLLPGLGQFYSGRKASGAFFLSAFLFPFYYLYLIKGGINYGSLTLLGSQGALYALQALDAKRGVSRTTAPCEDTCPAAAPIPAFTALAESGRFHESYAAFMLKAPLPFTLGQLCPAPCEKKCGVLPERPLRIGQLHREVGRIVLEEIEVEEREPFFPRKKVKVAVIGGGAAGLTATYYLASVGVEVTLFEKEEVGGLLNYIPEFKADRELIRKEVELLLSFKNVKVVKEELHEAPEGFDATVVAVGAQREKKLKVENFTGEVVYPLKFLKEPPPLKGKRVAVIGAGDTAFDVARSALRGGAEVELFYRGEREKVKAQEKEVRAALMEGLKIYYNCDFLKGNGKELRFSCKRGNYDYLIPALGFEREEEKIEKLKGKDGFVTGDAATGMTTFVEAVGRARETAAQVLKRLGLEELAWFQEDYYEKKPEKPCGKNLFVVSESSLCQHCGEKVKS